MNFFRFALSGMVVLLYLLGSCSSGEMNSAQDGSEADKNSSVTNGEDTNKPSSQINSGIIPELQINEMRTEYESTSSRAEYIEFKMRTAGNLSGLRVFIASNYNAPRVFEFLPVEVAKDEYVVLHLRTLGNSCKNEYGSNLNESSGTDSSPTARDFWVPGNKKLLRKTDAIYVLDKDDNVLDAVMIAEDTSLESWPLVSRQDCFPPAAEFLFNKGAWKSAGGTISGPADAVDSSDIKTSLIRSISRDETAGDTNTAADWYISNGVTPGGENNPTRF